jgi:hypothetical protein
MSLCLAKRRKGEAKRELSTECDNEPPKIGKVEAFKASQGEGQIELIYTEEHLCASVYYQQTI